MTFAGFAVVVQQSVDQTKQLHDTLVLTQIFVSFQQERIVDAVRAAYQQFARALFRADHRQRRRKFRDAHQRMTGSITTSTTHQCRLFLLLLFHQKQNRLFVAYTSTTTSETYVPGTARSKSRARNKRGDTYCNSKLVNCGNCLLMRRNT